MAVGTSRCPPNESEEIAGSSTSQNSLATDNVAEETPPSVPPSAPRTVLDELGKVPLVVDVGTKVLQVHGTLGNQYPYYSCLTSVILQAAHWALQKAEKIVVFQWFVEFGDCMLLGIMDYIKSNIPQVYLPSKEMFQNLDEFVKKEVASTVNRLASYSVPQKLCRLVEYLLKMLEKFSEHFTVDKDALQNMPWWFTPNFVLVIYERTVNRVLLSGICHVHYCRLSVRSLRKAGARVMARDRKIQCRRKVSPRKTLKRKAWIGFRCLDWIKDKVFSVLGITNDMVPPCFVIDHYLADSPNKEIPSEEKKRKLSAVEEESSCCSTEEESLTHYLITTLTSYTSGEDPDYVPSVVSTGSSEYDTSDGDDDEEDCLQESSLESYQEIEFIQKGKKGRRNKAYVASGGNSDAHQVSQTVPAIEIQTTENPLTGHQPENPIEKSGNTTDKSDRESVTSKEGAKSTSTPEARRKSLLRW